VKINIRMDILDSLVDSDEGIDQIENYFKYTYYAIISKSKILAEIEKLLAEKLIVPHYDEDLDYDWYELTPKGQAVWDAFDWDTYLENIKHLCRPDDD
jgi:predicted transcriptional regulator